MNTNLAFDFSVDKENNTIKIKREFAAVSSLVWDAYTKSEILDKWWAPKPWKTKTKTMDFREGGHWHYAMVGPAGEVHWGLVNYKKIQPQKMFSGIDVFVDENRNLLKDMPESDWEVTFSDKGEMTLVEFFITYGDLAQLEANIKMGFKEGITMAMEGLDELLASQKK